MAAYPPRHRNAAGAGRWSATLDSPISSFLHNAPRENPPQTPIGYLPISVCGGFLPSHPVDQCRCPRTPLAIVLLRFVCVAIRGHSALGCDVTISPPLGGWRTVFLALGSSKAPRGVGSVLARGPPEPDVFAVCANAPRFARNTLRATGRNGFDAQIPNANLGRMDDTVPMVLQRSALMHRDKVLAR